MLVKNIQAQYLGRPVVFKGRRPPSLFLVGGGSELEGLEDEDGRVALSWVARALGSPDLKFKTAKKILLPKRKEGH